MTKDSILVKCMIWSASIIGLSYILAGCENSQKDIDTLLKPRQTIEVAYDVESYMSNEGVLKARLRSPIMNKVTADTPYIEFPTKLHVDFYNDSVEIETRLDCKYAKYFENEDKVYLRDSVVAITIKGDTLMCPDLWWDQTKGIFYTDKYAEYRAKDQQIQGGEGLEATQDLRTVTFKKPTGSVPVNDRGL